MEYLVTGCDTPLNQTVATLDEAIKIATQVNGRYFIQVFSKDGDAMGRYGIAVDEGVALLTFKAAKQSA